MIYQLYTGEWIDLSHVLTIDGPYNSTNGCSEPVRCFRIQFKFRDSAIVYSKRMPYIPMSSGDWTDQQEKRNKAEKDFDDGFNKLVSDWMSMTLSSHKLTTTI